MRTLSGVHLCVGQTGNSAFERLIEQLRFPEDHAELLLQANGVSVFDGYFRLFGIGSDVCRDIMAWNRDETWRFAWPSNLDRYVMFGETAWGDQYAYSKGDLAVGVQSVYLLDAFEMQPEEIASSFEEFAHEEFLRCAQYPYDSMLLKSHAKFGGLKAEKQLTYIPALMLGGVESIENVHVIDARANMIINGDIAAEVGQSSGGVFERVEHYLDSEGRMRVRVLWASR